MHQLLRYFDEENIWRIIYASELNTFDTFITTSFITHTGNNGLDKTWSTSNVYCAIDLFFYERHWSMIVFFYRKNVNVESFLGPFLWYWRVLVCIGIRISWKSLSVSSLISSFFICRAALYSLRISCKTFNVLVFLSVLHSSKNLLFAHLFKRFCRSLLCLSLIVSWMSCTIPVR